MLDINIGKQIQDLVKDLDLMDESVGKKVSKSIKKGASIVENRQKELIQGRSQKFADAISQTRPFVDKEGNVVVKTGYNRQSVADVGIGGIVLEYGRPGKKRGGKTKRKSKNGKEHEMIIGKLDATPHIRKGFDESIEEAIKATVDDLLEEVKL